ncbi:MAG: ferredoxin [Candidatus Glassbacteria bacterium]|nr:ferredoxin [Candidatus Glassbacteria bacterium]
MAIKRVWIEEGCTACGMCEDESPEVFEVAGDAAVVREDVDLAEYEQDIINAVESCPVQVIQYEED